MTIYDDDWKPSRKHFKFTTSREFKHIDSSNVDYYVAHEGDTVNLVFESTKGRTDWLNNFVFFPKKFDIYPGSKIMVHAGFGNQYRSMRNEFLDLIYNNIDKIKSIFISGYSLGGALAQLATQDAIYHFPTLNIRGISYEGPLAFCYSPMVRKMLKNSMILIKNFYDPVVHVPPVLFGFRNYGKKIYIGKWNRWKPIQHAGDQVELGLQEKFGELTLKMNTKKTTIYKINKEGVLFLKGHYILTETGKVVIRPNKAAVKRMRRRIYKFGKKLLQQNIDSDVVINVYKSWRGGFLKRFPHSKPLIYRLDAYYLKCTGINILDYIKKKHRPLVV